MHPEFTQSYMNEVKTFIMDTYFIACFSASIDTDNQCYNNMMGEIGERHRQKDLKPDLNSLTATEHMC